MTNKEIRERFEKMCAEGVDPKHRDDFERVFFMIWKIAFEEGFKRGARSSTEDLH